ncbi:MAG: hypothetical protein EX268_10320 [Deltaproteobacteria bacterium]|nr:hypothetical protein [Deltaproteobacteria bacterium]NNK43432.1 hypothetical protein [Myxococcales bacterium]RZV53064.1 MAG: hypothetical protein EX268_10320 [Deltaproteobacteria bacterium]
MSETDLVLLYTRRLERAGFTYMITGSVAGVFYGEPRVTHDVDLVLALKQRNAARIGELFPLEEFYWLPEEIIVQEVLRAQRGHFNLIHHESGFKADVFLANRDPFHQWALSERRTVEVDGEPVRVAPLEHVIVRKLEFYREGGSEKHLRDIEAMLRVSGELIREDVLQRWVVSRGVEETWRSVEKAE